MMSLHRGSSLLFPFLIWSRRSCFRSFIIHLYQVYFCRQFLVTSLFHSVYFDVITPYLRRYCVKESIIMAISQIQSHPNVSEPTLSQTEFVWCYSFKMSIITFGSRRYNFTLPESVTGAINPLSQRCMVLMESSHVGIDEALTVSKCPLNLHKRKSQCTSAQACRIISLYVQKWSNSQRLRLPEGCLPVYTCQ